MSRFIKKAIPVPSAVQVALSDNGDIAIKGPAGEVRRRLRDERVEIVKEGDGLRVQCKTEGVGGAVAGTFWRVLQGMVLGASQGIERTLLLQGWAIGRNCRATALPCSWAFRIR